MGWPPSADAVLAHGPLGLLALATPIAALTAASLGRQLSEEEKLSRAVERGKRQEQVQDLVATLEKTEDPENDTLGQINFDVLSRKVVDLQGLDKESSVFEQGFNWLGKLYLKELRIASDKTKGQEDVEYADGTRVDRLISQKRTLDSICKKAAKVGVLLPESVIACIRDQLKIAQGVRSWQKRRDVAKAMKMILKVKKSWPWIFTNSAVSVLSASCNAMTLHYSAEVLETFRDPNYRQSSFVRSAAAMVIVKLANSLLEVLKFQLSAFGNRLAQRELQVKLFRALVNKDITWWDTKKSSNEMLGLLRNLPSEIEKVLSIPRDFWTRAITIATQAALVRKRSSKMLYVMLALNWVSLFVSKGVKWFQQHISEQVQASIVRPAQSDSTWFNAIQAENVSLFQSFVRCDKEVENYGKYLGINQQIDQKVRMVNMLMSPLRSTVQQVLSVGQFRTTGELIRQGELGVGQAEVMIKYASDVSNEVEHTFNELGNMRDKCNGLAKAYDLISIAPTINPDVGEWPSGRALGHVKFEDVYFEYPSRQKAQTLKGVSFEAKPGTVVGIT